MQSTFNVICICTTNQTGQISHIYHIFDSHLRHVHICTPHKFSGINHVTRKTAHIFHKLHVIITSCYCHTSLNKFSCGIAMLITHAVWSSYLTLVQMYQHTTNCNIFFISYWHTYTRNKYGCQIIHTIHIPKIYDVHKWFTYVPHTINCYQPCNQEHHTQIIIFTEQRWLQHCTYRPKYSHPVLAYKSNIGVHVSKKPSNTPISYVAVMHAKNKCGHQTACICIYAKYLICIYGISCQYTSLGWIIMATSMVTVLGKQSPQIWSWCSWPQASPVEPKC